MSAIIPRWEWRTFGTRFGVRRRAIRGTRVDRRAGGATRRTARRERLPGNAKIRDGLMDIKLLLETQQVIWSAGSRYA